MKAFFRFSSGQVFRPPARSVTVTRDPKGDWKPSFNGIV